MLVDAKTTRGGGRNSLDFSDADRRKLAIDLDSLSLMNLREASIIH